MRWSVTLKIAGVEQETFVHGDLKKVIEWIESKLPEYGTKRSDYEIVLHRVEPPRSTGSYRD